MKKRLPALPTSAAPALVHAEPPPSAMARWTPEIQAAAKDGPATISIYEPIGFDPWTGEGFDAKKCAAILRSIGGGDVVVNINSPGGSMFEGIAVYNMLRDYPGEVTVKVMGMAASAASVIAMAGDRIEIGRAAFLMIHNCWIVAIGNANDLRAAADTCEPFDAAMAEVYAARTGIDAKRISKLMDAETWIGGDEAVAQGFADGLLPADASAANASVGASATRTLDLALARAGMPRSERRRLIQELKGTHDAAPDSGTPGAADTGADEALSAIQALALSIQLRAAALQT